MKSLVEINETLEAFGQKFNFPVAEAQQGSEVWLRMKLGVISASNASAVVAKKDSETRLTYMTGLVSEVCTGVIEEMNFKQMEWGKQNEDGARSTYEFSTGKVLTQVPFIFKDLNFREGCSPDSLIADEKGIEIKCPWDSGNYVKFLVADKIKSEWQWQNQFSIRVAGADEWDMSQYDPRMKAKSMKTVVIKRDPEMQKKLEDAVPEFIYDMDKMLSIIGIKFGAQWVQS
jgi:hypothetical protein